MRKHPVKFTPEALADIERQVEDPDGQEALVRRILEAYSRFPRSHGKTPLLDRLVHEHRTTDWVIIYEGADQDPEAENEELDDQPGAAVKIEGVFRNNGMLLEDLARKHRGIHL